MNFLLRTIYVLFLSGLIAFLVGVMVDTVHPHPVYPEMPDNLTKIETAAPENMTEEQAQAQADFDRQVKEFDASRKPYARNVALAVVIVGAMLTAISAVLKRRFPLGADVLLFGGAFTLAYAVIRSMESENATARLVVIGVSLVVAAIVGYHRFAREKDNTVTPAAQK